MNLLTEYITKHLPKRKQSRGGHRITFEAKLDKTTWILNVQNDTNSNNKIAIAVKKGTKGKTATTRMKFNFNQTKYNFIPVGLPLITKL